LKKKGRRANEFSGFGGGAEGLRFGGEGGGCGIGKGCSVGGGVGAGEGWFDG